MKLSSLYFVLTVGCMVNAVDFRYDYKYYEDINGWLKFHEIPVHWHKARDICRFEGAVLASPLDNALRTRILSLVPNKNAKCGVYTGISSVFCRTAHHSIEGVPLSKIPHNWAPNTGDADHRCIFMHADGNFDAINCAEKKHQYTCYRKKTANNTVFRSDCGTIDKEYILNNKTGHCYKVHTVGRHWETANLACQSEGGHLVIINSENEANFVKDLFAKYPANQIRALETDRAYIGVQEWSDFGNWLTVHGQTIKEAGYAKWGNEQPKYERDERHCGALFRSGVLNDVKCTEYAPFICEKDPSSLVMA